MANCKDADVMIGNTEYSVYEEPGVDSDLVSGEKNNLLGWLQLNSMMGYVERTGKLIRLSFYAARRNGYEEGVVEMKMLFYYLDNELNQLSCNSVQTVSSFGSASRTALQDLEGTFQSLRDGFGDAVLISLQLLCESAQRMSDDAHAVQVHFEKQEQKVLDSIKKFAELEWKEEKDKHKATKMQDVLKRSEAVYVEQFESLDKLVEEKHKKCEEFKEKEDKENEQYQDPSFFKNVKWAITGARDTSRDKVLEWKAEAQRQLEIEEEHKRQQTKLLELEKGIVEEIERFENVESQIEKVISNLHSISKSLKMLAELMMRVALLFGGIKKKFDEISKASIKSLIEGMMKESEEKQQKYWRSTGFKRKLVTYFSKWVALQFVCSNYVEHVGKKINSPFGNITENPSKEQAQKQFTELFEEIKVHVQNGANIKN